LAANQLQTSEDSTGTTTYTYDATGNLTLQEAPGGRTTSTWDIENQPTLFEKPDGSRVTMTYNADHRRFSKET